MSRPQLPIPDKPPYTAHVGNLSFDASEGEIEDFFASCNVTNVRLVRDRIEDRPKGFGYVEFGSREGLVAALELNGSQLAGRNVRISVAEPRKCTDSSYEGSPF
jgi:translation initiation factor 4B